jgi:hypothetical protein
VTLTARLGSDGLLAHSLGVRLRVECGSGPLRNRLAELLAHLEPAGPVARRRDLALRVADMADGGRVLSENGVDLCRATTDAEVVDWVVWRLNLAVVDILADTSTGLHTGGVQCGGATVLLPAASGSGKSTLTASLVGAGWGYLSDEAVELTPDLHVHGHRKPISLERDVEMLFTATGTGTASHVLPGALGGTWAPREAPRVTHVVFPRFDPDSEPRLVEVPDAEAVMRLARCTFYFIRRGGQHLPLLARLVRSTRVFAVTYPDSRSAVGLVVRAVATGTVRRG